MIQENMTKDEFALVVVNTFEENIKDDTKKDKIKAIALKIADLFEAYKLIRKANRWILNIFSSWLFYLVQIWYT